MQDTFTLHVNEDGSGCYIEYDGEVMERIDFWSASLSGTLEGAAQEAAQRCQNRIKVRKFVKALEASSAG